MKDLAQIAWGKPSSKAPFAAKRLDTIRDILALEVTVPEEEVDFAVYENLLARIETAAAGSAAARSAGLLFLQQSDFITVRLAVLDSDDEPLSGIFNSHHAILRLMLKRAEPSISEFAVPLSTHLVVCQPVILGLAGVW